MSYGAGVGVSQSYGGCLIEQGGNWDLWEAKCRGAHCASVQNDSEFKADGQWPPLRFECANIPTNQNLEMIKIFPIY